MSEIIKKNIILFFLAMLPLISSSCNSLEDIGLIHNIKITREVNFRKGFNIQLKINNLSKNGFSSKNLSDPILPRSLSDVKSFSAFLTTNFKDPFSTGSNPRGNGILTDINYTNNGQVTITFSSVVAGGPYFASIAAFDDFAGINTRKNITNPDPTILSLDKFWARSSNSVTIQSDGKLIFSDGSNDLKADITLKDGTPNSVDIKIIVNDGNPVVPFSRAVVN